MAPQMKDYSKDIKAIKHRYEGLKRHYYLQRGKEEQLKEKAHGLQQEMSNAAESLETLEGVKVLLQKTSEVAREKSKEHLESLVTSCLKFIFDEDIEFTIEIDEVRGRPEAEFYVLSRSGDMVIKTRPQESRGGGVIDIISLAIRIAMLENNNLGLRGPVILDEPARHVSEEYITKVAEFLKQASIMFKRQIIIITHNRFLSELADRSYRIEISDGISVAVAP